MLKRVVCRLGPQNITIENNHFGSAPDAFCTWEYHAINLVHMYSGSTATIRFNYFEAVETKSQIDQGGAISISGQGELSDAVLTIDATLNAWAGLDVPLGPGLIEYLIIRQPYLNYNDWGVNYSPWLAAFSWSQGDAAAPPGFAPAPGYTTAQGPLPADSQCCVGFAAGSGPAGVECSPAFPAGCSGPGPDGDLGTALHVAPSVATVWVNAGVYTSPYLLLYCHAGG